jgi:hypothetical protein
VPRAHVAELTRHFVAIRGQDTVRVNRGTISAASVGAAVVGALVLAAPTSSAVRVKAFAATDPG